MLSGEGIAFNSDVVPESFITLTLAGKPLGSTPLAYTVEPRWQHYFDLPIHYKQADLPQLSIALFERDHDTGDDIELGTCTIDIAEVLSQPNCWAIDEKVALTLDGYTLPPHLPNHVA